MAYVAPHTWTAQEVVNTTTKNYIQQLNDNVTALIAETVVFSPAMTAVASDFGDYEDVRVCFSHAMRYLYYWTPSDESQGTIYKWPYENPEQAQDAKLGDPITLPGTMGGAIVDLEQDVPWLVPGMMYFVDGCNWCFEVEFPY